MSEQEARKIIEQKARDLREKDDLFAELTQPMDFGTPEGGPPQKDHLALVFEAYPELAQEEDEEEINQDDMDDMEDEMFALPGQVEEINKEEMFALPKDQPLFVDPPTLTPLTPPIRNVKVDQVEQIDAELDTLFPEEEDPEEEEAISPPSSPVQAPVQTVQRAPLELKIVDFGPAEPLKPLKPLKPFTPRTEGKGVFVMTTKQWERDKKEEVRVSNFVVYVDFKVPGEISKPVMRGINQYFNRAGAKSFFNEAGSPPINVRKGSFPNFPSTSVAIHYSGKVRITGSSMEDNLAVAQIIHDRFTRVFKIRSGIPEIKKENLKIANITAHSQVPVDEGMELNLPKINDLVGERGEFSIGGPTSITIYYKQYIDTDDDDGDEEDEKQRNIGTIRIFSTGKFNMMGFKNINDIPKMVNFVKLMTRNKASTQKPKSPKKKRKKKPKKPKKPRKVEKQEEPEEPEEPKGKRKRETTPDYLAGTRRVNPNQRTIRLDAEQFELERLEQLTKAQRERKLQLRAEKKAKKERPRMSDKELVTAIFSLLTKYKYLKMIELEKLTKEPKHRIRKLMANMPIVMDKSGQHRYKYHLKKEFMALEGPEKKPKKKKEEEEDYEWEDQKGGRPRRSRHYLPKGKRKKKDRRYYY